MDEGPFRTVPKTGVIFVMGEAARFGYTPENRAWANLGQGAPETGPLPNSPQRLTEITCDLATSEYSPVVGAYALRQAVADLYNQRYRAGSASLFTAENVAISPGGRSALTRVAAALGRVNLGHFLPDYTAYEELLDLFRRFVPIPIALRRDAGFRIEVNELEREINGRGLSALLISNPCNPTGQVIDGDELRAWLDMCRQTQCATIWDEFYAHYRYGDLKFDSAARYIEDVDADQVVILDGLTKNWRYPGLRISWTLAPKQVIQRIASAGSFLDGGAPHPVQLAAIPLIERSRADQEAHSIQAAFKKKRDYAVQRLTELGMRLVLPQGSFYVFADLSGLPEHLRDGLDFFRRGLEHQVITVPGEFFDVNPGKRRRATSRLRHYVRISFGPSMDELKRGFEALTRLVRSK
ncbi:MAG: pyridoxal phosphate-dependent aminotransferase [Acidobacteria bacterium]|nr:pyridoxal phosphate-dependent aminotransferase [Acidobacteriota bacterium]